MATKKIHRFQIFGWTNGGTYIGGIVLNFLKVNDISLIYLCIYIKKFSIICQ